MASEPAEKRDALPFEPKGRSGKRPKRGAQAAKVSPQPSTKASAKSSPKGDRAAIPAPLQPQGGEANAIPAVVSQRMVRRMVVFSGIPTALAVVIFVGAYVLLSRHILEFSKSLVLLSTLGCFGLGVVGLSYGVLSASWDEAEPGSLLGTSEFKLNFGRMVSAWRAANPKTSSRQ